MALRFSVLLLIVLLVDIYFYQAVVTVLQHTSQQTKNIVKYTYWGFTIFSMALILAAIIIGPNNVSKFWRVYVFSVVVIVQFSKLLGIAFIFIDDLIRFIRWIISYTPVSENSNHQISRIKFIQQSAIVLASIPFITMIYGMFKGAFDYRIRKVSLKLPNLPDEFRGLKIIQISDIHTGSFTSEKPLERAFKIINGLKADMVFFTGDLVNDKASELDGFEETFKKISAPLGVYSILGNHDYGDYVRWESEEAKKQNLSTLVNKHHEFGWKLLKNENHVIEKNGKKLAIIGVENWGANLRFPKYGKLDEALKGAENADVKLLLSHDPSHWDAQITKDFSQIDATFSGHTHGMQFGVEIPGFKWSPVQYFYKQWAGLYKKGNQYLYVNRGLGFIGYPGRVGILPEISLIELA